MAFASRGGKVRRSPGLEFGQLELQPTVLHQAFPFLLVLDVSPNLLGIEPNRVGAVTLDLKVIAPIELTFRMLKPVEDSNRRSILHRPNIIRYRNLWRNHHQQVYMVDLYV